MKIICEFNININTITELEKNSEKNLLPCNGKVNLKINKLGIIYLCRKKKKNSYKRQGIKSLESSSSYTNKYKNVNGTEKNSKHKRKIRTVNSKGNKDGLKTDRISIKIY